MTNATDMDDAHANAWLSAMRAFRNTLQRTAERCEGTDAKASDVLRLLAQALEAEMAGIGQSH